jgi:hypothetical protein
MRTLGFNDSRSSRPVRETSLAYLSLDDADAVPTTRLARGDRLADELAQTMHWQSKFHATADSDIEKQFRADARISR